MHQMDHKRAEVALLRVDVPKPGEAIARKDETNCLLGYRDAFHCPAVLVQCIEDGDIAPGTALEFIDDDCLYVRVSTGKAHAVADPFVDGPIDPQEIFWAFLLPGVMMNLRHHFDVDQDGVNWSSYDDGCGGCNL